MDVANDEVTEPQLFESTCFDSGDATIGTPDSANTVAPTVITPHICGVCKLQVHLFSQERAIIDEVHLANDPPGSLDVFHQQS